MNDLIQERLSELKTRSFNELSRLRDYQAEKVKSNGKEIVVAVWKDIDTEGDLRVVIQTYRPWFLGIGRMDAGGFKLTPSGTVQDLKREEIYEFV